MTSFLFELDHPKDEAAAAFVAKVGRLLQTALVDRKEIEKITQQEIASRLGIDRSRVNKCFSGYANLSLESLAEICWAMDVEPELTFKQLLGDREINNNSRVGENVVVVNTRQLSISPSLTGAASKNTVQIEYPHAS
ncbi:hypothetical protein BCY90_17410 [Agrobacterium deltaense]|uniref:helix-turn-helix domain-containing protein n=1 Tax=Agrobacterium TaxID=357 RepID=UPI000745A3C6|nr:MULTISPECIES: helix-turn-helix transcriptional regulator [Agrobacterium]KVK43574.1 hypothetical protein L901_26400 [Agrobacterium sp. D14]RKF41582.1 hypothetical protein BCY90_17410 [Agrobacterium deltaense]